MVSSRPHSASAAGRWRIWLVWGCLIALIGGCGPNEAPPPSGDQAQEPAQVEKVAAKPATVVAEVKKTPKKKKRKRRERPKPYLSEYGLFEGPMAEMRPAAGVMPYDLNSALFSDYAWKSRFIKVPEGEKIEYREGTAFEFPVGTVIAKTFYFPTDFNDPAQGRRLIETRVLLLRESGWIGVPYLWNDEQTDAVSEVAGETVNVSWTHYDGEQRSNPYIVPNANDCKRCHTTGEFFEPIGPRARYLNKDYDYPDGPENQLVHWTRTGILTGAPDDPSQAPKSAAWKDEQSGTVAERARAWLEINCAHCHSSTGPARNSGLHLLASVTDPYKLGVYKTPVAAGRGSGGHKYDIVPGHPDESIMLFRLMATHPGMAMPEFGRSLVEDESVALIHRWIEEMQVPEGFDVSNGIGEFETLTDEQLAEFAQEVAEQGDAARGEEIFHRQRVNCFKCHTIGGAGEGFGPDLLKPLGDQSLNYLIEALLLPNKAIPKGFETVNVVTDSGETYAGIVLEENDSELVLRDLTRPEIRIPHSSIEQRNAGVSLMPANAVSTLPRQDVVDLLRFLTELGQPGEFQVTPAPVIRSWQVLDPLPSNIARVDANRFIADLPQRRDLTWEAAYSRTNGALALESVMAVPQSSLRIVRCQFNVTEAGNVAVKLNATDGLRIWLDGDAVDPAQLNSLNVEPGTREITFMIDLDQRDDKTLRCEIHPAANRPAAVQP
ncbi:Cytochrome c [Symmachiella macrocystis]|uniref:Cytochrome c n=1 Tax=Symmachiella macrocystis TaxID=2527985 RepID=A0A5C6BGV1_9PLAN|nr:SO2930 family diheme c-type cytochrome [Symmachiella macrocystis]TWU11395.1 Cytochrome c [Symmachiella macrocystis]